MKKTWKKVVASVLTVVLSAGTFATVNHKTVSAEDNTTATTETVKVTGASIRFISENTAVDGIRFAVTVAKNDLESVKKQGWKLLVMPTALVDGELDKDESYGYDEGKTAKPVSVDIDWNNAKAEGDNQVVRIYLNEIDANYYTTDITARAYCEDNGTVTYSNELKRSYYEVAEKALDDVKDASETGYTNQAGSKYSPYDATQRDALLGVKYEKTGTWDLQDGNLVTNGSETTSDNTKIHPMLIDRAESTDASNYVIETSFNVGVSDDSVFVGKADNTDTSMKGFMFAYNESNKSYYLLDFRYRNLATPGAGWYPYIRYYNGTGWSTTIGKGSPIDAGWSDFRIAVNATDTTTEITVEYKKQGENIYTTIINSRTQPNTSWADGTKITGSKIGFYSTLSNQTLTFDSNVKVYDNTVQTRGNSSVKLNQTLNDDGTGTIKGQFITDYRTTGDNQKKEGIKFSGTNGNGYYFWVGAQPKNATPRFYVGMWRNCGTDTAANWNNTDMSDGASVLAYSTVTGETLKDKDEITVDFEITISINSENKKAFVVKYTLSHGTWSSGEKSWSLTDKRVGQYFTGGDVYLCSEDNGSESGTEVGDGKTLYYPISVNGKEAAPGEPSVNESILAQTNGVANVKLNQQLNNDGTGTIKGSFITDYRTKGSNSRREGIKFSGTNGNGYYFWIGAQPEFTTPRFYIGMWRNTGTETAAEWGNANMSTGADVLAYSTVTGETLQDNDEITVDFEITISINSMNQKAFIVKYSLSHGTWSSGEQTWSLVDNRAGQYYTGGEVYLCSEDNGNPDIEGDVGDGKTIYNWITVNGNKASVVK